jgi:hypothetical protein
MVIVQGATVLVGWEGIKGCEWDISPILPSLFIFFWTLWTE